MYIILSNLPKSGRKGIALFVPNSLTGYIKLPFVATLWTYERFDQVVTFDQNSGKRSNSKCHKVSSSVIKCHQVSSSVSKCH